MRARIVGTGRAVPEKVLTNADFEKMVETSDEWITARTGIKERRIANDDEALSDFAIPAAQQALDMAGVAGADIDLVICATVTPDTSFPATSTQIQHAIGATTAASFDLSAACTGFIYGLGVAETMIQAGKVRSAVVVGGEMLSKIVDYTERSTSVLFGDGAGAAVVVADEDPDRGILAVSMHSDGSLGGLIDRPGGGSRHPINSKRDETELGYIRMRGNETFKVAVRRLAEVSDEALAAAASNTPMSVGSSRTRPTGASSTRSVRGWRSPTAGPMSSRALRQHLRRIDSDRLGRTQPRWKDRGGRDRAAGGRSVPASHGVRGSCGGRAGAAFSRTGFASGGHGRRLGGSVSGRQGDVRRG